MIEIQPVSDAQALAAARDLIRAHLDAHSQHHDAVAKAAVLAALPAPYVPPTGGLWVAWEGVEAAGCVALHALTPAIAELKRMYVRPESRGRGIARTLAQHAIGKARVLGYERLRLGTLTTMLPAQKLYTSLGFQPIPAYRGAELGDTLFYELDLGTPAV